jgi:hypothetical protein
MNYQSLCRKENAMPHMAANKAAIKIISTDLGG